MDLAAYLTFYIKGSFPDGRPDKYICYRTGVDLNVSMDVVRFTAKNVAEQNLVGADEITFITREEYEKTKAEHPEQIGRTVVNDRHFIKPTALN